MGMNCTAAYIPYDETGRFSKLVLDYIHGAEKLKPFYQHAFDHEGMKQAIAAKQSFSDRQQLFDILSDQYKSVSTSEACKQNLQKLLQPNTFTVCTAHQPNLFTGPLYFIYKIAHAIQLAQKLSFEFSEQQFVPVYYMGSEDADLEELGHIYAAGKKYNWETNQTGAVGRMLVDKKLTGLIKELEAQFSVQPFGNEILSILKNAYTDGKFIQQSTFELVNELFGKYGLIILIPDSASFKKQFIPAIQKELEEQFSKTEVEKTIAAFPEEYKVQAAGRKLNLFYLQNNSRERIELEEEGFTIANTSLSFTKEGMLRELHDHPERFSPNVILRPVFQETILPNVAFIGGGGEIAYWLELKHVFKASHIPMPVLVLRNSFLFIQKKQQEFFEKWDLKMKNLFQPFDIILKQLIAQESKHQLSLQEQQDQLENIYKSASVLAGNIDPTLQKHVEAIKLQSLDKVKKLEKKMYRAEKRKFEAMERQLNKLYQQLFPGGNLQERVHNLVEYYAHYGSYFIETIMMHSQHEPLEFGIINEI